MLKRSCGLAVKALDYYTTYHWSKVDNSFWQQQPLLLLSLRKTSLRCFQHYRKLFCHPTEKNWEQLCGSKAYATVSTLLISAQCFTYFSLICYLFFVNLFSLIFLCSPPYYFCFPHFTLLPTLFFSLHGWL